MSIAVHLSTRKKIMLFGLEPFINFFHFFGHLCITLKSLCSRQLSLSWNDLLQTVMRSGLRLMLPMIVVSGLIGTSLVINIYRTLSPYHLQHDILLFAQNELLFDFLPFLINLILAIQSALYLVDARIKELQKDPSAVVLTNIIPIMIGTNISALLLYIYTINTVFISLYYCFRHLLFADVHEYLFYIANTFTSEAIIYSFFKTNLYCTLVSLIVGYYYYEVAEHKMEIRVAMSRIITRSFIWLVFFSIYFKFIES